MKFPLALLLVTLVAATIPTSHGLNLDTAILSAAGLCGDQTIDDLGNDAGEVMTNTLLPDWDANKPFESMLSLIIPAYDCVTDDPGHKGRRRLVWLSGDKNEHKQNKRDKLRGVRKI